MNHSARPSNPKSFLHLLPNEVYKFPWAGTVWYVSRCSTVPKPRFAYVRWSVNISWTLLRQSHEEEAPKEGGSIVCSRFLPLLCHKFWMCSFVLQGLCFPVCKAILGQLARGQIRIYFILNLHEAWCAFSGYLQVGHLPLLK